MPDLDTTGEPAASPSLVPSPAQVSSSPASRSRVRHLDITDTQENKRYKQNHALLKMAEVVATFISFVFIRTVAEAYFHHASLPKTTFFIGMFAMLMAAVAVPWKLDRMERENKQIIAQREELPVISIETAQKK